MRTILIVDSDEVSRRALCAVLRSDEYEIIGAASGPEALALLHRERPVDVIIAAYRMSEMNGLEFLRCVRDERTSDALRIMLVSHDDLDVAVAAINESAVYRFVLKPWDGFDLRVMIRTAMRHIAAQRKANQIARLGQS